MRNAERKHLCMCTEAVTVAAASSMFSAARDAFVPSCESMRQFLFPDHHFDVCDRVGTSAVGSLIVTVASVVRRAGPSAVCVFEHPLLSLPPTTTLFLFFFFFRAFVRNTCLFSVAHRRLQVQFREREWPRVRFSAVGSRVSRALQVPTQSGERVVETASFLRSCGDDAIGESGLNPIDAECQIKRIRQSNFGRGVVHPTPLQRWRDTESARPTDRRTERVREIERDSRFPLSFSF